MAASCVASSNYSCTTSTFGREVLFRPAVLGAFVVAYAAVAVGSLVGNGAVLLVVASRADMRSVPNLFIGSLAASDLLVTLVSLWTTPYYYMKRTWVFGETLCYVNYGVSGASLFLSPFTLAAMAVDRYVLVVRPFSVQMSRFTSGLVIAAIWAVSATLLLPALVHVSFMCVDACHKLCFERWPRSARHWRLVYGVGVLLARTLVPFALIAGCHLRISGRLNDQQRRLSASRSRPVSPPPTTRLQGVDRTRRLQRLLLLMTLVFAVCSFPLDIFNIVQDAQMAFDKYWLHPGPKAIAYLSCHLIAMTGTLLNPIIYAWLNENFKRQLNCGLLDASAAKPFTYNKVPQSCSGRARLQEPAASRMRRSDGKISLDVSNVLISYRINRSSIAASSNTGTRTSRLQSIESAPDIGRQSNGHHTPEIRRMSQSLQQISLDTVNEPRRHTVNNG